jgi:peptide/nickel transport system permease protein
MENKSDGPPGKRLENTFRGFFKRAQVMAPPLTTVATPKTKTTSRRKAVISRARFYLKFIWKDKAAFAGLVVIVLFLLWSLVEGIFEFIDAYNRRSHLSYLLLGENPLVSVFSRQLDPPSLHSLNSIFGYDFNGGSIFIRILYAAPRDAAAAMLVVASGIVIGMFVGTGSAYYGGWIEQIFMRLTDAFLALPALVLAIAIGFLVGSGFGSVLVALTIVWWPTYARFFRGQALALKNRGFVDEAKLSGVGSGRILLKHIIPNSVDPIIAYATLDIGNVILTYSALAFLGIGVQPPLPEWGAMAFEGLSYLPQVWWWSLFPGVVILIIVISFTLVGDRVQDLISGRTNY